MAGGRTFSNLRTRQFLHIGRTRYYRAFDRFSTANRRVFQTLLNAPPTARAVHPALLSNEAPLYHAGAPKVKESHPPELPSKGQMDAKSGLLAGTADRPCLTVRRRAVRPGETEGYRVKMAPPATGGLALGGELLTGSNEDPGRLRRKGAAARPRRRPWGTP